MQHSMKLLQQPFEDMKNGTKTIEFRLNDEKRRQIKIGDTITFYLMPDLKESLTTEVLDLYKSETFEKLLNNVLNDKDKIKETLDIINTIYSKEDEQQYGALGIKIKLLD